MTECTRSHFSDVRCHARAWMLLILLPLSLSGCLIPVSTVPGEGLSSLADFAVCEFRFPDGTSGPCPGTRIETPAAAPPEGWACVEEVDYVDHVEWRLYSDGNGRFGLDYAYTSAGASVAYVRMAIEDSTRSEVMVVGPGEAGFAAFEGRYEEAGEIRTHMFVLDARGSPDWLGNDNLSVLASWYQERPWLVWAFNDDARAAYFQSMAGFRAGGEVEYEPVSLERSGTDFSLNLTVAAGFDIAGPYYADMPGPAGLTGNACEPGVIEPLLAAN